MVEARDVGIVNVVNRELPQTRTDMVVNRAPIHALGAQFLPWAVFSQEPRADISHGYGVFGGILDGQRVESIRHMAAHGACLAARLLHAQVIDTAERGPSDAAGREPVLQDVGLSASR